MAQFRFLLLALMSSRPPRIFLLLVHRWVGLLASAALIVISLTGAALVFEQDVDEWLHPDLWSVAPHGQALPLSTLLQAVQALLPDERLQWVELSAAADKPIVMHTVSGWQVFVDPYTGAVLGDREYEKTFFGLMFLLHRTLLAGHVGQVVVGLTTLVSIFLFITGIYLWWPRTRSRWRSAVSINRRNGPLRLTYDLHNVLGFYTSWVALVIAMTGLVWSFPLLEDLIFWATNSPPPPWKAQPCSEAVSEPAVSIDTALRTAEAAVPDAKITEVMLPNKPHDPYVITKHLTKSGNPNAQSQLCVGRYSGQLLELAKYEELSLGATLRLLVYPLHVGTIYGRLSQVLAFVVALVIPISAVTGFLLWSRKRRRRPSSGTASTE